MSDDERGEADEREAPLSELASEVRERRQRREAEGAEDDLFEKVDVGDVDSEEVWEALVEEGTEERLGVGREPERATVEAEGREEHLVSKREYCQRCPHFSTPPEVACTREGTEIIEVVDDDTFRLRNCPMVTKGPEPPRFE